MGVVYSAMVYAVAVVGYVRMGLIHARNVVENPRLKLKYLVGRNESAVKTCATQFENVQPVCDLSIPLEDPEIKGIIICSPTEAHAEQITAAIKAKKAVFCEKPVALSPEKIEECFNLAEEHQIPLFCGYQRRFDPHISAAKHIAEKSLGDITLLRVTSRDHPPPPEEYLLADSTGSFFDDFSTHDVDFARWMTGQEPESVYATASSFMGSDDTAVVVLKFPSGALCVIDNSRQTSYGYDVRAEVLGVHGMATIQNPLENMVLVSTADGHTSSSATYSFPERFTSAYKIELNHWVDIIEGKSKPLVAAVDCIGACKITKAAQESRITQLPNPEPRSAAHSPDEEDYPSIPKGSVLGAIIFGTGRMGRVRATALQSKAGAKVLYGFDIIEASVQSFAEEFNCQGFVLTDESMNKALADPNVSVVFVSTTSSSHCKLITAALNAGKHVFCEKPLALTAADTELCVNLANEKKLGLYCGFHRRSDAHFQQLKRSIKGVKQLIRITSREPASNSGIEYLLASGGFLFDSVIHDIDMAVYLTEEYPFEVYCQAHAFNPTLREAGDVDAIIVVLRFPSGCIVSIDNHRSAVYGYDQRAEVHTSRGMYSVGNLGRTTLQVADSRGFTLESPPDFLTRYREAYFDETRHFVALLQGDETIPRSPIRDYVITARIAEAARASLAQGKPVPFN